ncbi:hypothetical protein ACQPX6_06860 [Actinomycetospora sp. CA-101289]|uniref:hypothetical protein n=1 Tax=Actinomycetospora sp. CA-101289 TaxID=3239893 RepID=UPI003D955E9C
MLISMFGLNPNLRRRLPEVAQALLDRAPLVTLPEGTRLSMALFRGRRARISGGIGAVDMLNTTGFARRVGIMSDAQVYFPSLSWELEDVNSRRAHVPDFWSLTEAFGWGDVSSWTRIDPRECRDLHSIFLTLPAVCHPEDIPGLGDDWVELVSDNISEILVADVDTPGAGG